MIILLGLAAWFVIGCILASSIGRFIASADVIAKKFFSLQFNVSRCSGEGEVMPEETILIQPVAVVGDKDGWWYHPDIPNFGGGEDPAPYFAWTKEQGL